MALSMNIGKCSLLGNYRENNEDSIEVKQFPDLVVAVVADGMGGQAAGEIASRKAIEIIPRELRKSITPNINTEGVKNAIRAAIVTANEEIMAMGAMDKEMRNMGTTVVCFVWRKSGELYVAGVGDSRGYMVRGSSIEPLTVDHSLAQALVEANTITAAEAKDHRFKNVLWKYLGSKEVGDGPDVSVITIQSGDKFLICTDGLTGVVNDESLQSFIAGQTDMQACSEGLGQLALDQGSRDNVSCIVAEFV